MLKSDRYYGKLATHYDSQRDHKPCWQREQDAVARMVVRGPVLDCPLGTGRYVQIYNDYGLQCVGADVSNDMIAQAIRKHPDLEAYNASVFNLPFRDKQFGTVVCSRLLPWFYPRDMFLAVRELRRVASVVVVSVRLGDKGEHHHQSNYTHSWDDFYTAIDGLWIEDRAHILSAPDGEFWMFSLRKPSMVDVEDQFRFHAGKAASIVRLCGDWTAAYGIPDIDISTARVRCEYWTHEQIGELVHKMAETPRADGTRNKMITDQQPRFRDFPLTVMRTGDHMAMIDGRRRSNQFMNEPGRYPVFVMDF